MGLALLKALVSLWEPKLAQSGCSSHLSSLLVLTQCPVAEKNSSVFHFVPITIIRSPKTASFGGNVWLHFSLFSLHDLYVRMYCLPSFTSVCPCHISAQGGEHWRTLICFTASELSLVLLLFCLGRSFPCCSCTCRAWNPTWKTFILQKDFKKYLALVTQTIDFIVFM